MMKIKIDDVEYRVRWFYHFSDGKRKDRTSVTCIFSDNNKIDIASGTAYVHPGNDWILPDKFDKEIGRIISMNKCMRNMNLTREQRKQAYAQYHKRPKG